MFLPHTEAINTVDCNGLVWCSASHAELLSYLDSSWY